MRRREVYHAEIVDDLTPFDKNPLLSTEEWRLVARALLCYPETSIKLRRVATVFLQENRVEV